jgi:hypothetical protein
LAAPRGSGRWGCGNSPCHLSPDSG